MTGCHKGIDGHAHHQQIHGVVEHRTEIVVHHWSGHKAEITSHDGLQRHQTQFRFPPSKAPISDNACFGEPSADGVHQGLEGEGGSQICVQIWVAGVAGDPDIQLPVIEFAPVVLVFPEPAAQGQPQIHRLVPTAGAGLITTDDAHHGLGCDRDTEVSPLGQPQEGFDWARSSRWCENGTACECEG